MLRLDMNKSNFFRNGMNCLLVKTKGDMLVGQTEESLVRIPVARTPIRDGVAEQRLLSHVHA